MDTRDLQLFIITYESQSFSAAARKAFMSPQGVAKSITKMEAELAVPLFTRTTSGITPTNHGHALYQHATDIHDIFTTIQHADASVQPLRQEVVNLFSTMGFLDMLGFDFFATFYEQHPEIILNLVEFPDSALRQQIDERRTNLAFTANVDFEKLDGHYLTTNDYGVIMSPDNRLAQEPLLTADLLASVPQAIMGREYAVMNRHISQERKHGPHTLTNRALETGNVNYIIEFARQNYGIGILQRVRFAKPPIRELLASGQLVTRPTAFALDREVYFVSRNDTTLTKGERQLRNYILSQYSQHESTTNPK